MAYSAAKRKEVLGILHRQAEGNTHECARLTGISAKTIEKWQETAKPTQTEATPETETETETETGDELPLPSAIKQRIICRVYEIIETCSDPKKLMDTYEAISKFERETGQQKESIFDMVARKLAGQE